MDTPAQVEVNVHDALTLAFELCEAARFAEAEGLFRAVVAAESTNVHALNGVGLCLNEQGKCEEALPWFDRGMMACRENMVALSCNRGHSLGEMGRAQEALALFQQVLVSCPGLPLAHYNRGLMLMQLGDYRGAIRDFDEVLRREPGNAKALFGRGFANLVLGNYAQGFRDYEHRLKDDIDVPNAPLWTGLEPLFGKTILIHGEQGHGDDIMFLRYVPLMLERGAKVLLVLHPGVGPIIEGMAGVTLLSDDRSTWPKFDYWVRMMSLAAAFETVVETVPKPLPIHCDTGRNGYWSNVIGSTQGKLNIGLCWAGNTKSRYDQYRSIPLKDLLPLFDIPGVRFYSFAQTIRDSDREAFEIAKSKGLVDIGPLLKDFGDTAHAMACLDRMITVDTSVAHMAGTVGVPTTLLLTTFRTYWLWIQGRETTPWYPSVRCLRQAKDGDWPEVVTRLCDELMRVAHAA